jgi:valine--pyruvate aminotransferase
MKFSAFGDKLSGKSGILDLMDDLGRAMDSGDITAMLGGGNPAHIPEINAVWRRRMEEILAAGDEYDRMLVNYDTPQGKGRFLEAVAELFSREYGWEISPENVAVTNSSQSAFMILLNMFSGPDTEGRLKKILFPLLPEYVGYADQGMCEGSFVSHPAQIVEYPDNTFKYTVDFEDLPLDESIGALCVSRPTNPSGNVLTDEEVRHLAETAGERNIPLLIDNAYGVPFPGIVFSDVKPYWDENVVLGMSLSKIGLPSTRTGIIIARKEIIEAVSAVNAVMSLSSGTVGQVITEPLIRSGEILRMSREIVNPYYRRRSEQAQGWIREAFSGQEYSLHRSEGAIFLWLWFKNLSINTRELYEALKRRKVLVIPGRHFFYGTDELTEHCDQCIRINYSQAEEDVKRGIEIIAEETARYAR